MSSELLELVPFWALQTSKVWCVIFTCKKPRKHKNVYEVGKYQTALEACSSFIVFSEKKILFSEEKRCWAMAELLCNISCSDSPLIALCLALRIWRDESWRWEVEIGESRAIIHSCLYKPQFPRDYFSLGF